MSEFEVAIKIAGKLDKSLQTSVSSAQKMLGSLGKGGLSSALTGIGNAMENTGKALTTGVTMPVIALGATSVKEFGSVDKSMKLVQATMGSTNEEAATLEATMKKAAANSVFGMHRRHAERIAQQAMELFTRQLLPVSLHSPGLHDNRAVQRSRPFFGQIPQRITDTKQDFRTGMRRHIP